ISTFGGLSFRGAARASPNTPTQNAMLNTMRDVRHKRIRVSPPPSAGPASARPRSKRHTLLPDRLTDSTPDLGLWEGSRNSDGAGGQNRILQPHIDFQIEVVA